MESRLNSPEFGSSPRPKPTESVMGTEKKQKLGSILFGPKVQKSPQETEKIKKEIKKKPEKKIEKEAKEVPAPQMAEVPQESEKVSESEPSARVVSLVERLKAVRREQVIIAEIEAAQPEVVRARSLARRIIAKLRREQPVPEQPAATGWRDVMPERSAMTTSLRELDQAVRQGEQADQNVRAATRERHLHLVPPIEENVSNPHPLRLVTRWRQAMFPALAAGTGAAIVGGGGAAARGVEAMAPTAAMMAGEPLLPRVDRLMPRVEVSAALVGAGALFIAGLWVGRRRGERRAEKNLAEERTALQQKLEQQEAELRAVGEAVPEVALSPQPAQVEQMLRQEIVTQQQITVEQEGRFEKLQAAAVPPLPANVSVAPDAAPVTAHSVAEFAIPTASRAEAVARPLPAQEYIRERVAPVAARGPEIVNSASAQTRPEAAAHQPEAEPVVTPQMSEYEMKPIIIKRLERITGNRRSAEHVYELLKASHSSPAEILALTPEKLKAKASDAMKRDAARLVLGKTLQTPADETTTEAPIPDTHLLMHELQKPPAMSLREFLAQPSKQRDRALAITCVSMVLIAAVYILFL